MGATQDAFFAKYVPLAQAEQARSGLPASLLLAQMIQESGFTISELAAKYNNFFGIKVSKGWTGEGVGMWNKARTDYGVYRVYDTPEQGFTGRTEFLQKNQRYSELLKMTDPYQMAQELQRVGYAEDKNYAASLTSHMKTYNLTQYDDPSVIGKGTGAALPTGSVGAGAAAIGGTGVLESIGSLSTGSSGSGGFANKATVMGVILVVLVIVIIVSAFMLIRVKGDNK